MYRIHFDIKTGKFVVQVVCCHLFWRSVPDVAFANYFEAVEHVKLIGLDQLYADRSVNKFGGYTSHR